MLLYVGLCLIYSQPSAKETYDPDSDSVYTYRYARTNVGQVDLHGYKYHNPFIPASELHYNSLHQLL